MKLKNKKTGEIRPAEAREDGIYLYDETTEQWYKYELDHLAKWWEYYEEPKEYWYIEPNGVIARIDEWDCCTASDIEIMKILGNYFETKEEAELAVRKLKAWKRLKDKGFKFKGYADDSGDLFSCQVIRCSFDDFGKESRKDLDLLFCPEENS